MKLEEQFEIEKHDSPFGPFERLRIKGHRIGIENVLDLHKQGVPPEDIVNIHYPTLTLAEVYGTIACYLQNLDAIDAILVRSEAVADGYYQEWLRTQKPSGLADKLRNLRTATATA